MRTKKGIVVSNKMNKTVVVEVVEYKTHTKYKKRYKTSKKYYAHDELQTAKVGDDVMIVETRPLSKLKCWMLMKESKAAPAPKSK